MGESEHLLLGNLDQIRRSLCFVTAEVDERLTELFDASLEGPIFDDVGIVPGMRSRGDFARKVREECRVEKRSWRSFVLRASETVTMSIAFRS
jgi:hypothetical protein